ncbi:acyltransferase [Peptoanaerobacter stomatis]|uniref:Acyltransferase n=1 Tax=Peptoanaerobacter stomatis TaxID=796937 RepID=J6H9X1_9FIRM|nr:lysophospholipid acyltransferase family protein [Peptoanaerobacter stomatis]EJU21970.1 acyltransferase [Peptoanaerobacter stomatis]NWO24826.1 1-acyl-sn-glycerol-3-phosphate acyltransferase [Peptostreptococcaceae bacterium oral taxon 081]
MLYSVLRFIINIILRIFYRIEVVGNNTVESDKAYIVASNHRNNLDPLLVIITFNKRKIHYIAKKELFENKILKFILDRTYVISLDRNKNDLGALKESLKVLKDGEILGIFPQGTRVSSIEDDTSKAGIGMFAMRTNTPVIPVSIVAENNYKPFSKIKIIYHDLYTVPEQLMTEKNNEGYIAVSNEVMQIIKSK